MRALELMLKRSDARRALHSIVVPRPFPLQ